MLFTVELNYSDSRQECEEYDDTTTNETDHEQETGRKKCKTHPPESTEFLTGGM